MKTLGDGVLIPLDSHVLRRQVNNYFLPKTAAERRAGEAEDYSHVICQGAEILVDEVVWQNNFELRGSARWWFQIFLEFSPLFGEDVPFDKYFSNGLKPPTRSVCHLNKETRNCLKFKL